MSFRHELARDSRGARHRVGREVRLREDLLHHGRVARVARGERIEQPGAQLRAERAVQERRWQLRHRGLAPSPRAPGPVTRQQRDHRERVGGLEPRRDPLRRHLPQGRARTRRDPLGRYGKRRYIDGERRCHGLRREAYTAGLASGGGWESDYLGCDRV